MTETRRFERDLPVLLIDLAAEHRPDYLDDVFFGRMADIRQRPAWTFPERWLPMEITTQAAPIARLPWRQLGILAMIGVLIAVAAAAYIGSQPALPEPFGRAATGLVAYADGGDIYTADPATGATTALATGSDEDSSPVWSKDGTRLAFQRADPATRRSSIYVIGADGSDLTLVTPEPLSLTRSILGEPWEQYEFSPDGRSLVIAATEDGHPGITIAQSDGSGVRRLDVGRDALEPSYRPPDGAEILFVGTDAAGVTPEGIFAVDVETGTVRTIVEPVDGFSKAGATWSPDGSRIAYWSWFWSADGLSARTHIVEAGGTGDRTLLGDSSAAWDAGSAWSNDGTRILVVQGVGPDYEGARAIVVPVDGNGPSVDFDHPGPIMDSCCAAWEWAPDDSVILGRPTGKGGRLAQVILDPGTGTSRTVPWSATSVPAWQRVAP
jgi:dipeptidyl aminopeptidase/acylaminoacyl peptidase